jgi:hypothetical protein
MGSRHGGNRLRFFLDRVFKEARLFKAAELMWQEDALGGTAAEVQPAKKPPTKEHKFTMKRVSASRANDRKSGRPKKKKNN